MLRRIVAVQWMVKLDSNCVLLIGVLVADWVDCVDL